MIPEALTAAPTKKKRLAIFLDGTWNTYGDNTNVWRLKSLCAPRGADGLRQEIYYDPGVGSGVGERVKGGIFGYGLSQNVKDAYDWLLDRYEPDDEIYVFGFSRGAYTARTLTGFIAKCGLLKPGAPLSVTQLYGRFQRENDPTIWALLDLAERKSAQPVTHEERWMLKYSQAVSIRFVGVWDTVGALGIPVFNISGISRNSFTWMDTGLRRAIERAFHAVAIDEHRSSFSPTLWTKNIRKGPNAPLPAPDRPVAKTEQRWFVGAHANVGGGYVDDPLPQIPLRWMMIKATESGLGFRTDFEIDSDALTAPIADSFGRFLRGTYRHIGKRHYRVIGEAARESSEMTTFNVNETIDASVFERWRVDNSYRPENLRHWACRQKVDMAASYGSVRADDAQVKVPD